ncbi:MAG: hypothetical protein ACRD99_05825 [Nitrososphaera sp.]
MPPPIDAAEFDAHKSLITIITQFLRRNKDRGFSAEVVAQSAGIIAADVSNAMLKLGLGASTKRLRTFSFLAKGGKQATL